jgi:hypothetical protein
MKEVSRHSAPRVSTSVADAVREHEPLPKRLEDL